MLNLDEPTEWYILNEDDYEFDYIEVPLDIKVKYKLEPFNIIYGSNAEEDVE